MPFKHAVMVSVLLIAATPVATAVRSVNCDLDEPDFHGGMHVRLQQCSVQTNGKHVEISIGTQPARWVLDPPQVQLTTTSWTWWNGAWHRTEYDDRTLWTGTVTVDNLPCRFGGHSTVRYVFSNDTAVCLLQ
jgi:hypothetical protein